MKINRKKILEQKEKKKMDYIKNKSKIKVTIMMEDYLRKQKILKF